jgi:hypothetical protein
MSRTASGITWVAGACTLVVLALLLPRVAASSSDGVREIHLVARDMTYYVDGRPESNPTLRVARGEHVRIRLTNNDPGMSHDFSIRAWNKGSGRFTAKKRWLNSRRRERPAKPPMRVRRTAR